MYYFITKRSKGLDDRDKGPGKKEKGAVSLPWRRAMNRPPGDAGQREPGILLFR
jgi:hypothetical protein